MIRAKFDFAPIPNGLSPTAIVLTDTGHSEGYASITNDAEEVVKAVLRVASKLAEPIAYNKPEIYYFDSEGQLGQLEHNGAEFTGFGG